MSNTNGGVNPGNITFHTHGLPFRDPNFQEVYDSVLQHNPGLRSTMDGMDSASRGRLEGDLRKVYEGEQDRQDRLGGYGGERESLAADVNLTSGFLNNQFNPLADTRSSGRTASAKDLARLEKLEGVLNKASMEAHTLEEAAERGLESIDKLVRKPQQPVPPRS